MFTTKKIAAVSVINDLVTDNRVNKTCQVLIESGYEVILIGRVLPESLPLPAWQFKAVRMNLIFKQGPLFYLFFNLRLFLKLLFIKRDLLFANDLDTLLPNYLVSKLKKIPLVYDSHELFTEVPELINSSFKRKAWLKLERKIIPRLKNCLTVNESIAKIFENKYGVQFKVIRNIPSPLKDFKPVSRQRLNMRTDKKIIIMQGAGINIDRGAEELIEAMRYVSNAILYIIGSGDVWRILEKRILELNLREKVILIKKIPRKELMAYTYNADLGVSIDKNTNLNYFNSLPNKIFDYLHAGIPVLSSRLPELEKIISKYDVGIFIENHDPKHIASVINGLLSSDRLNQLKTNTFKAAGELNWENERQKYLEIIKNIHY
ncbi:MAG: glycosyl transferase group 1 [Bacteroidetes bacterium]|nr:glycosyl transferase group 1 [Bacteroidota bacterium]